MTRNNPDFLDAINLWQGNPGELSFGIARITGDAPEWMAKDTSRYMRERTKQAQALLDAVQSAPTNSVTLYRGYRSDEKALSPLASYTTNRTIAQKFAKKYGGKVKAHKPGTIRAVQTPNFQNEEEWIGERPEHPYWSK